MRRVFCAITICGFASFLDAKPRVSIITSVYNGDEFIEGFLQDQVQQSIFNECELLLINANSPGNEEPIIKKYMEQYPNIVYKKLDKDPGIYGVWNLGVHMAQADLVTNANLDDRRNPVALEMQVKLLEENSDIDLAYGDLAMTLISPNQEQKQVFISITPEFTGPEAIRFCLPGPQPVWRKSMHQKYGYFDESFFSSGDWDMWCRAVSKGALFKKVPNCVTGLYYQNPVGISTDPDEKKTKRRNAENERIIQMYSYLWDNH